MGVDLSMAYFLNISLGSKLDSSFHFLFILYTTYQFFVIITLHNIVHDVPEISSEILFLTKKLLELSIISEAYSKDDKWNRKTNAADDIRYGFHLLHH